jgi:hypothetical protein
METARSCNLSAGKLESKFVHENQRYVVIPLFEGDQSGCCIKNTLNYLGDGNSGAMENAVVVVDMRCHERMNEDSCSGVYCD